MITTKAPIGEIINYIHKNPNSYIGRELLGKIETLVDLVTIRTRKKGINHALDSLLDDFFKLRFEIINNPELVENIFEGLNDSIEERIKLQFNKSTTHKELEQAFVNAIDIYRQIAESLIGKISNNPIVEISNLSTYTYNDFVNLLNNLPGNESQFIIAYIKFSIFLDYSFIVSELIFDAELKLPSSEIKTLSSILKNSIEEFAIYSSFFGLWTPNDSDESQWIRNIKIRISLLNSKVTSNHHSAEEINKILAA